MASLPDKGLIEPTKRRAQSKGMPRWAGFWFSAYGGLLGEGHTFKGHTFTITGFYDESSCFHLEIIVLSLFNDLIDPRFFKKTFQQKFISVKVS